MLHPDPLTCRVSIFAGHHGLAKISDQAGSVKFNSNEVWLFGVYSAPHQHKKTQRFLVVFNTGEATQSLIWHSTLKTIRPCLEVTAHKYSSWPVRPSTRMIDHTFNKRTAAFLVILGAALHAKQKNIHRFVANVKYNMAPVKTLDNTHAQPQRRLKVTLQFSKRTLKYRAFKASSLCYGA